MSVSAKDTPTTVIISGNGKKGDPGNNGTDGEGFNQVRYSKLNNPLCHLFKTNDIASVSSPTNENSDVVWNRATPGSEVDIYNGVNLVAIDTPREESQGFLVESAATNVLLWSEAYSNAAWLKLNAGVGVAPVVTADHALSPDGIDNADRIVLDTIGSSSADISEIVQPVTSIDGIASFWIKSLTSASTVQLITDAGTNLLNITTEWKRFDSLAGVTDDVRLRARGGQTTEQLDLLVWTSQLEAGAFSSSIVHTTSASATRSADFPETVFYNNISNVFEPWSFIINFTSNFTGNTTLLEFGDSSSQQRVLVSASGQILLRDGTGFITLMPASSVIAGEHYNLAVTYDGVNAIGYINGVAGSSVPAAMIAVTGSTRWGNRSTNSEVLNGHMNDARFYDFALNADEITYLSGL